jgi:hypothetical protein
MNEKEQTEFASYLNGSNAAGASKALAEIEDFRAGIIRSDAMRSLFFILLGMGVLWFFGKRKDLKIMGLALAAICLIDLWIVDKRYVNNEKKGGKYLRWEKKKPNYFHEHLPTDADESILSSTMSENPELPALIAEAEEMAVKELGRDGRAAEQFARANARYRVYTQKTHFRVYELNNPFNESRTSFFHKSIGGYSAVKMGRYQDMIDFYLRDEAGAIITSLKGGGRDIDEVMAQRKVLNMLNTRYIVYNPEAPAIPNRAAYGNAWFIEEVLPVENADKEIMAIAEINPQVEAVSLKTEAGALPKLKYGSGGSITLSGYKANELTYAINIADEGFAVFSEMYYKHGWQAYADGQKVPHYRVNYILRGMVVPAGTKEIVFKFEPIDYPVSNAIGYASSILLLLLAIGLIGADIRRSLASADTQK